MEADAWLVEDIERTDEVAAQRCGKVDALAFTSGKRRRKAVERKVLQPYVAEVFEPRADFSEQAFRHFRFVIVERQAVEPCFQVGNRHFHDVGNCFAVDFHVECFFPEPAAFAFRAGCFAAVAGKHHAVLYFVLVFLEHVEKVVDSVDRRSVSVPKKVFFFVGQLIVGAMDGETR